MGVAEQAECLEQVTYRPRINLLHLPVGQDRDPHSNPLSNSGRSEVAAISGLHEVLSAPEQGLYDGAVLNGSLSARDFHELTKHRRYRRLGGRMDPANRPLPFKVYTGLELLPFHRPWAPLDQQATEALAGRGPLESRQPTRADVERICHFSNGVLRWREVPWLPGGRMAFRAAPCTGALYHIELYLACAELEGLPAGLYHYCARDSGFRCLRPGDWRGPLAEAAASEAATIDAPALLLVTSTFWRNAWKYGPRAYRHTYWDGGVVIANALAAAHALELPAKVVTGFVDAAVNRLIDVDPDAEAAVAMVALGCGASTPPAVAAPQPLGLATEPLSAFQERFDLIPAAHAATSFGDPGQVLAWRRAGEATPSPEPIRTSHGQHGGPSLEDAIIRRRSTRRFAVTPIKQEQLIDVLDCALAPVPSDAGIGPGSVHIALNGVEGLGSGTYRVDGGRITLIRSWPEADIRVAAMQMSLVQELAADAAVNVCFLADLDSVLDRLGDRGWRAAHMGAAIAGGRLEVAAQALGLGATGLTFFDDEVTDLFGLDGRSTGVCYLAAVGVPASRKAWI